MNPPHSPDDTVPGSRATEFGDEAAISDSCYRRLFDTASEGILILDASTLRILSVNPAYCRLCGYEAEELIGRPLHKTKSFNEFPALEAALPDLVERGVVAFDELVLVTKDEKHFFVEFEAQVFENGDERLVQCRIRDITARKRRLSEQERFFTLSLDILCVLDLSGVFQRVNPAVARVLGFMPEEMIGKSALEFLHPDDLSDSIRALEDLARGMQIGNYVNRFRCRDGSYRSILWVTSPFGPYFYAAGRDITDRVQALTALREREQFQSTLFENFPNGAVSVLDEEFRYVMAAGRSLESRGISPDQLIGKTVVEAFSQGYADQVVPHFRRALNGESVQFELAIGDFFYLVSSAPLRDELTGKTNILSVSQDITERRAAEAALQRAHDEAEALVQNRTRELRYAIASLESARATAEQASQAKSEFLSRMSHELRTPLNAILGFGQVLDMQPLDEDSKDFVSHILRGGRHLLDLINEVLDITRVETGHLEISLEPVHVAEIVSEACALMAVLAAERGVTIQDETSWLPGEYVLADRQRLKQVLINLIANAIKYNRDAGQVRLASRHEGDMLAIDVSDTGPGIASDDLAKLFTPFERLNASASGIEGTGLGLALSQRLITAMDGSLGVESTPGVGSVFTLRLSRAESASNGLTHSPDLDAPEMVPSGPARKYTVLCIEDNPSNLRLIEVILNSRPAIQLLTAIQGSVGLDLARNHQPDLILLDLNLPDMNGKEVLSRLKLSDRTQDIPVIIVSADATPHQVDRLLAGGAEAFLTKPLDVPEFLRTLDEWFGR